MHSPSPLWKTIFALLSATLLIGIAYFALNKTKEQSSPCRSDASGSLTATASFFAETIQTHTDSLIGGHPIEGYEPALIRQAYPNLQPSDFACVEASGGRYEIQNTSILFVSTADPSHQTSADRAITAYGMGRLLENIAHRLNLPLATEADVGEILNRITVSIPTDSPQRVTLEGEYVCLPHKDVHNSQTEECAFGLKTGDGKYYAIDTNFLSSNTFVQFKTGDRLRAQGILTPIERLSSDHWQKYTVNGIFSITDSIEKR